MVDDAAVARARARSAWTAGSRGGFPRGWWGWTYCATGPSSDRLIGMGRARDAVLEWLRSAAQLLVAVVTSSVALVLLLAFGVGLVLVPVFGLGLPVVAGALGATRRFADVHRLEAGRIRGTVLGRTYVTEPGPRPRDLVASMRDPRTWRDALWLTLHFLVGQVVSG